MSRLPRCRFCHGRIKAWPNFLLLTVLWLGLLPFSRAEPMATTTASAPPLLWQEAIAYTLHKNPALVALGHQFAAQAGRVQQAGLRANPEASLNVEDAAGSGDFSGLDRAETSLGFSWLINGGQRQQRVASAQARTSMLEVERDIHRLDAAAATARLFVNVLALQARQQQTLEAIDLGRAAVKMMAASASAGNSLGADVARAQVELSRNLLANDEAEHELAVARRQLAAQWGDTSATIGEAKGDIFNLPTPTSFAELQARFHNNPRMEYFVTSERWEASQLALAKVENQTQWKVSAGIKHMAATDDQALMVGLSAPLKVFDQQQGRIAEARANIELNRAEREAERIRVDAAVFALHQELLHNLHLVKAYRNGILPQLDVALKETRRAYDLGRYPYAQWQTVQRELLEAKNILLNASLAAHLKAIEIERLTGVAVTPHAQPK